jgi:RNA polymerase sigma-70 factor (ECF subfamily)
MAANITTAKNTASKQNGTVDLATLRRAQAGDLEAFRTFLEAYERLVYQVVYRMVAAHPDVTVEDAAQDIFLKLFEKLGSFDPERGTKLSTWVLTVVKNYCFDLLKKRRVATISLEDGNVSEQTAELRTAERGPVEETLAGEAQEQVAAAIGHLPLRQRMALVLREYEGLSLAEIAGVTGTTVGVVKSRIHRAKQSLRARLENYWVLGLAA